MMPGVVAGIQIKWEDIGNSNKSHDFGVSLLGLAGPQTMPHCIREKINIIFKKIYCKKKYLYLINTYILISKYYF